MHLSCAAFALLIVNCLFASISYPDFLVSMLRGGNDLSNYESIFIKQQQNEDFISTKKLEIFRNIYAQRILLAKKSSATYRIPQIVHQIWLGSPVPPKFYEWMNSWIGHLGWEYKLWTDEEVKKLPLFNQDLYDKATNYGEKSDILRLEVLLHYGGIYVDVDFQCVNPEVFEELHRSFDFYIGFEPINHGLINGIYKLCNAIIASVPHHPLLEHFIVNLRSNCMAHRCDTAVEKTGPDYISREIMNYELDPARCAERARFRTIYLPCTFFYPYSEPEIRAARSAEELFADLYPETAAIHYWTGSWFK